MSSTLTCSNLSLTGAHPYYPALGEVTLTVPIHAEPPGVARTNLGTASVDELREPNAWTPLTSEFLLIGPSAKSEATALIGLLWDLTGQPYHPTGHRRPAASFAVVIGKGRAVTVWRPIAELKISADAKALRDREKLSTLPDARRRPAL